ncbi:MAG: hypothetical protein ABIU09_05885 [Pyrinomonadaceae bacterium]
MADRKYKFKGFMLDGNERIFSNDERVIQLPPKVFDTLLMLVEKQRSRHRQRTDA